jgi:hypothetical protein
MFGYDSKVEINSYLSSLPIKRGTIWWACLIFRDLLRGPEEHLTLEHQVTLQSKLPNLIQVMSSSWEGGYSSRPGQSLKASEFTEHTAHILLLPIPLQSLLNSYVTESLSIHYNQLTWEETIKILVYRCFFLGSTAFMVHLETQKDEGKRILTMGTN